MSTSTSKRINRRRLHDMVVGVNLRTKIQAEARARAIADDLRQQAEREAKEGFTFLRFEADPDWGCLITKLVKKELRRSHLRPREYKDERGEKGGKIIIISWW